MLPVRCFTCGFQLSTIELEFEEERDKICLDPNLNNEQKEKAISKLVVSFKLNYCCNMNILTTIDLSKIIIRNY
jgi:DNA-directed RNA polymerase subunit N (RpoN/RPB10)